MGRVLVIDDEPAIRGLVAKIVQRAGLSVDTASDGADAIAKLDETDYSVVIVDLMMPRVDGFGVIDHIRSSPRPKPAVIVVSAGDPVELRRLDGKVVHSIVRKPFEIDVLGELVIAAAEMIDTVRSKDGSSVLPFSGRRN